MPSAGAEQALGSAQPERPAHDAARGDVLRPKGVRVEWRLRQRGIRGRQRVGDDECANAGVVVARRHGHRLPPHGARVRIAVCHAQVGVHARRRIGGNAVRRKSLEGLAKDRPAMPADAGDVPVDAPVLFAHPTRPTIAELIAAAAQGGRRRCSVLLRTKLQRRAIIEAPPEEPAIHVGLLIAGADVGAGVRCRVSHAPAAQVHAHLVGTLFDRRVFHGPQAHLGEIQHALAARIEPAHLQPIVEYAHPAHVTQIRGVGRRSQPAGVQRGDARHPLEQIGNGERSRRDQRIAAPMQPAPNSEIHRQLGVGERRLDGVRLGQLLERVLLGERIAQERVGARRQRHGERGIAAPRRNRVPPARASGRAKRPRPPGRGRKAASARRTLRGQRARPRTNSTNVPTGTPVGPRGTVPRSDSVYAVPATSRCTHG